MSGRLHWQDRQKHTQVIWFFQPSFVYFFLYSMFHLKFCIQILNISYHTNTSYFILFNLFFFLLGRLDNQPILIESQSRRLSDCHRTLPVFVYKGRDSPMSHRVSLSFIRRHRHQSFRQFFSIPREKCSSSTCDRNAGILYTLSFAFFVHMLGRCPIKTTQKVIAITTIII